MLRDALRDAYHQRDLCLDCLLDTPRGDRWWDEDGRGIGSGLLDGVGDGCKDWLAQVLCARLLGVCPANNIGALMFVRRLEAISRAE